MRLCSQDRETGGSFTGRNGSNPHPSPSARLSVMGHAQAVMSWASRHVMRKPSCASRHVMGKPPSQPRSPQRPRDAPTASSGMGHAAQLLVGSPLSAHASVAAAGPGRRGARSDQKKVAPADTAEEVQPYHYRGGAEPPHMQPTGVRDDAPASATTVAAGPQHLGGAHMETPPMRPPVRHRSTETDARARDINLAAGAVPRSPARGASTAGQRDPSVEPPMKPRGEGPPRPPPSPPRYSSIAVGEVMRVAEHTCVKSAAGAIVAKLKSHKKASGGLLRMRGDDVIRPSVRGGGAWRLRQAYGALWEHL